MQRPAKNAKRTALTEATSRTSGQDGHKLQVSESSAARTKQLDELERLLSLCEVQSIRSGTPLPLGASARGNGVNFAIFSRHATGVRLDFFDRVEDSVPARSILFDSARNKTGEHLARLVGGNSSRPTLRISFCWTLRSHDGHRFNPDKLVVDPYATAIALIPGCDFLPSLGYDSSSPQKDLSFSQADSAATAPKSVVTHADFDWRGDQPLRLPWESTVIYELHVRGYTVHPSAGVSFPGTYRGLVEKIPYLKDLGVTAVELMPVQVDGFTYASVESKERWPRYCRMRKAFAPARTMSITAVCLSTCGCCRASGRPAKRAIRAKQLINHDPI